MIVAAGSLQALLPIAGTLLAFEAGLRLQRRFGGAALANPVLIAVLAVSAALAATGMPADAYFQGMAPLNFLLGPATVALAVPLFRSLPRIRAALVPILAGVALGAAAASLSAVLIAAGLGADGVVVRSIASKSVTAAISMAVAGEIAGDPVLAAGLTVLTGIAGAIMCTWVFDAFGVHDRRARGIATGVAAHGIGTARMLTLDAEAGAFSSCAMGLAGFAAGVGIPLVAHWLRLLPG